ncbi:MAG: cell division protein FtsQ/DivIB [bacterium]
MDLDFKTGHQSISNIRLKRYARMRLFVKYAWYIIISAGLIIGSYVLYIKLVNFVTTSSLFSLKQVSIKGYEHVMPMEIVKASGLNVGENIFLIPLGKIKQNILTIPWIASVSIRKSPPHTLDITVAERKVYCMILLDKLYYVDEHGIIFKGVTDNDATNYPVITGFSFKGHGFMDVPLQPVMDATSFIKELDHNSLVVSKDISELHVDDTGYTVITTDGLLIRFGKSDLLSRINKLNALINYFGDRIQMFSSIDLRFLDMGVLHYKNDVQPESVRNINTITGNNDERNSIKEVSNIAKKG